MAITLPSTPLETENITTQEVREPEIAPVADIEGIPQSADAPDITESFGESPWEMEAQDEAQARGEWFAKSREKMDTFLEDPDKAFEGFDMSIARTRDEAVRLYQNDAFVRLHTDGEEFPDPNGLTRKLLRVQLAEKLFDGRGGESEEAFNMEIHKDLQGRKDLAALRSDLAATASASAILGAGGETGKTFAQWREEAKALPGYKPEMDGDLYAEYHERQKAAKEITEPFREELEEVWNGFKGGRSNFYFVFDKLEEGDREGFKNALGTMLRAYPAEERRGFFGNLAKQTGRMVARTAPTMLEEIVNFPETVMDNSAGGDYSKETLDAREAESEADQIRKDFIKDVRDIAEGQYDPVKPVVPWLNDTIESGLYQAPGVALTSAAALIPYAGQIGFYGLAKEESYDIVRAQVLASSGGDEAKARQVASDIAPIVAVPYSILERFSAKGLVGKSPLMEGVLTRVADRFGKNIVARASARAIGATVVETTTEALQSMLPVVAMEMDTAFGLDAGETNWTGEGGVFDGFWTQNAETFVASFPLALLRIPGGLKADQKARIASTASQTELVAAGFTPGDAAEIISKRGQGHASVNEAVRKALPNLDPRSETAKDATQDLAENLQRQRESTEDLQRLGDFPTFRTRKDTGGVEMFDGKTGEMLGTFESGEAATQAGFLHMNLKEEDYQQEVIAMASLLEAGRVEAEQATDENAVFNFDPGVKGSSALTVGRLRDLLEADTIDSTKSEPEKAKAQRKLDRIDDQLTRLKALSGMEGVDNALNNLVFGELETDVQGNERALVRQIYGKGSVLTLVHENAHAKFVEAEEKGLIDRAATIALFRALDEAGEAGAKKRGREYKHRLLPAGLAEVGKAEFEEAFAEFAEVLILGTKGGEKSTMRRLLNDNLSAMARSGNKDAGKLSTFVRAMRTMFERVFHRKITLDRAVREGLVDESQIDELRAILQGTTLQEEFDRDVSAEAEQMAYERSLESVDDENPFSIGGSSVAAARKDALIGKIKVETGKPVTFPFLHNKDSATAIFGLPAKGDRFDRDSEPSGRYVSPTEGADLARQAPKQFDAGTLTLNSPLLIDAGTYNTDSSWKKVLSAAFGGLSGKELSKALMRNGYDGVLAVEKSGQVGEVVEFTSFNESKAAYSIGPVVITKEPYAEEGGALRKRLMADIGSSIGNAYTGWEIGLSTGGAKHIVSQNKGRAREILPHLKELVESSVWLGRRPHRDAGKERGIRWQHFFYAPYSAAGEQRVARFVVNETWQGERLIDAKTAGSKKVPTELTVAVQQKPADSSIGSVSKQTLQQFSETVKSLWPGDDVGVSDPVNDRRNMEDGSAFSIGHSQVIDSLKSDVASRAKRPETKVGWFGDIMHRLEEVRRDTAVTFRAFGRDVTRKAIVDPRQMKSLRKEAAMREATRRQELEDAAYAKHGAILEDDALTKLKEQPIHAHLADPESPLKGQLMSRGVAIGKGENFFNPNKQGDYDGAEGVSRSVFGGNMAPDQAAQELFEAGLLREPTPDALWEALKKEQDSVGKMKQYLAAAKADMKGARETAKGESKAWLENAIKEQERDHSPQARIRRALVTLDAILMALPSELRGKVGGHTALANLNSDEKRLEYLHGRIEKADQVVEAFLRKEFRKEIDKLFQRAKPKKNAKGIPGARLNTDYTDKVARIAALSEMSEEQVAAEIERLSKEMDGEPDMDKQEVLGRELAELVAFGNVDKMNARSLESFFENLHSIYQTGKTLKDIADAKLKEEIAEMKATVNHDVTGGGGPLTSSQAKARQKRRDKHYIALLGTTLGGWTKFHRQNVSFEWLINNLARENKEAGTLKSKTHEMFSRMVHVATHSEKRANMEMQEKYRDALSGIFGGLKGMKLTKKIGGLMEERELTGVMRMDYLGKGATTTKHAKASNIASMIAGETNFKDFGMTRAEYDSAVAAYNELLSKSKDGTVDGRRNIGYKSPNVGAPDNLTLSQSQAINLTMLFRQEGLRESMVHEGYTEETMEQMEKFLTPESIAIREFLTQEYADNYHVINAVFKEQNGVSLPQNEFYSPARRIADGSVQELAIDSGGTQAMSSNPNFLISRTKNFAQVDQRADALSIYMAHMNQTNHYVHWAKPIKSLRSVFADKTVKQNVTDYAGADLLSLINERVNWMADGGNRAAAHIKWLDHARLAYTYSALGFNWGVMIKQLTSLPAYAFDMGIRDFGKYAAKFMANPVGNLREMWATPYVRTRFKEGYERDVIDGMRGEGGITKKILQTGMLFGKSGDIVPVMIGGWMARQQSFDRAKASGMSDADAMARATVDFEMITDRAQQAGDMKDFGSYQGGGSLFKLFTMFKTSPRQYYANVFEGVLDAKAGKVGSKKELARRLLIGQVILPLTFQFAADAIRSFYSGDDEEDYSPEDYVRAVLMGPLNGLFIAGDAIELLASGFAGTKIWAKSQPLLDPWINIAYHMDDWKDGDILGMTDEIARQIGKSVQSPLTFYDLIRKEMERWSDDD